MSDSEQPHKEQEQKVCACLNCQSNIHKHSRTIADKGPNKSEQGPKATADSNKLASDNNTTPETSKPQQQQQQDDQQRQLNSAPGGGGTVDAKKQEDPKKPEPSAGSSPRAPGAALDKDAVDGHAPRSPLNTGKQPGEPVKQPAEAKLNQQDKHEHGHQESPKHEGACCSPKHAETKPSAAPPLELAGAPGAKGGSAPDAADAKTSGTKRPAEQGAGSVERGGNEKPSKHPKQDEQPKEEEQQPGKRQPAQLQRLDHESGGFVVGSSKPGECTNCCPIHCAPSVPSMSMSSHDQDEEDDSLDDEMESSPPPQPPPSRARSRSPGRRRGDRDGRRQVSDRTSSQAQSGRNRRQRAQRRRSSQTSRRRERRSTSSLDSRRTGRGTRRAARNQRRSPSRSRNGRN